MPNINTKKIWIAVVAIVAVIFILALTEQREQSSTENVIPQKIQTQNNNLPEQTKIINETPKPISITVDVGDLTLNLSQSAGTTLYDALVQAQKNGQISFSGKEYAGLGFFMTSIGNLTSENGKNLIYYINGKQASVGVSSYTPKDGDVIDWKLE